jgi:hypothetical protein
VLDNLDETDEAVNNLAAEERNETGVVQPEGEEEDGEDQLGQEIDGVEEGQGEFAVTNEGVEEDKIEKKKPFHCSYGGKEFFHQYFRKCTHIFRDFSSKQ